MSELRRDPITGRWNIIVTDEPSGPDAFEPETHVPSGRQCPFCMGNESLTPPELHVIRPPGSAANGPGWELRVVSNKFPALQREGELERRGLGVFDLCNGVGAHEVIIETPDHHRQTADLTLTELERVIQAYKLRSLELRADGRLKYTLLFKNFGLSAGASLEHTHTQLIALPIVPKRVNEQLKGAERYFEYRDRCPYCDMLQQEWQEGERIVAENRSFIVFCPHVSNFPFEIQILPKQHHSDFCRISDEAIQDFAQALQEALLRIRVVLSDPSYNFIIHTAPIEPREREEYHWHLELIPKLTKIAGFEWGSGFYINPTPPELAAKCLREAKLPR